jgi:oxygen-independent coproporphyrinogen-3 oxidase
VLELIETASHFRRKDCKMSIGLYIHIPFCLKKCNYCDFISFPVSESKVDSYLDALEKEMELYRRELDSDDRVIDTLYLGGGTPTCLSGNSLRRVLEASRLFFNWLPDIEVTVEANPGTLDLPKLKLLRDEGVNRLSLGVQSFNPRHLVCMGRQHGVAEIREAVQMAREVGITNLSLDLIYGLPGQTLAQWQDTLEEALSLNPEHLSAYGLKIEEGTPWGELAARGKISPAGEDLARLMFDEVQKQCREKGYIHYEISNYAKPGYEARHNLRYWQTRPYLGLGVAAASYIDNKRWTNVSDINEYQQLLKQREKPVEEEIVLNLKDQMAETVILGLRTMEGVSLTDFKARYGKDLQAIFREETAKMISAGLLIIDNRHLKLSAMGLPIANIVFEAFV